MQEKLSHISQIGLQDMESRKRTNLINSLSGFKSIALIGTKDKDGHENLAIFNSLVHIGANPALMGFISRPEAHLRHTVTNILETKYYTINHIKESYYQNAHQTSARYLKDVSEFEACGMNSIYKENFFAPFVLESNVQLAMEFREIIDIQSNNTSLIVGEIKEIYFPSNQLLEDGYLDIESCGSLAGSGLDGYHTTKLLKRLKYAKTES